MAASRIDQADRVLMDNKQPAHSTGSWHVAIDLDHGVTVHSHDGVPICRMGGNVSQVNLKANAHRIVDSVNAHDDLVEALRLLLADVEASRFDEVSIEHPAVTSVPKARAALAKAGL